MRAGFILNVSWDLCHWRTKLTSLLKKNVLQNFNTVQWVILLLSCCPNGVYLFQGEKLALFCRCWHTLSQPIHLLVAAKVTGVCLETLLCELCDPVNLTWLQRDFLEPLVHCSYYIYCLNTKEQEQEAEHDVFLCISHVWWQQQRFVWSEWSEFMGEVILFYLIWKHNLAVTSFSRAVTTPPHITSRAFWKWFGLMTQHSCLKWGDLHNYHLFNKFYRQ